MPQLLERSPQHCTVPADSRAQKWLPPLAAGETATLEYSTRFHYAASPPPEFRRVVQSFVENLDIRIEFHPAKLPGRVKWAVNVSCSDSDGPDQPSAWAVAASPFWRGVCGRMAGAWSMPD